MDKDYIIELLNNDDIKYVTGILIELGLNGKDKIRIDYLDKDYKLKMIKREK